MGDNEEKMGDAGIAKDSKMRNLECRPRNVNMLRAESSTSSIIRNLGLADKI